MKYTKEKLEEAVANSKSLAGILRFLGLKQAGGTQSNIRNRIRQYKIDCSHFTGQGHRRGKTALNRSHWSKILVHRNDGNRTRAKQLRRALKEAGVAYKCVECGNDGHWNNKSITLEVDHIDGDFTNNLLENLQFLCPNCHSQKPVEKNGQTYLKV